jgi:hypothetical protein
MNKKIKELAEQAFESAHAENGNMPMMLEKFAELIVRECLNQLQELTPLKISNEEHQKLVDATHIAAVSIGVAKIKQHFGVKE